MKRYALLSITIGLLAPAAASRQATELTLRLVPIRQGISEDKRQAEAEIVTKARNVGIDLRDPSHPLLVHSYKDGRLFYVFYKTMGRASGPRSYLIQRIRKVERFYASPGDAKPRTQETFLVEAFKLREGSMKKADQHYGSYGISSYHKREVVKEYEIGFGQIDNIASGARWPFERSVLYKRIQDYSPDRTIYDRVTFARSKKWTLAVTFDRTGGYSIRSPELGFDVPTTLPLTREPEPKPAMK